METIRSLEELDRILDRDWILLYKHSTRCGLSTRARRQIQAFMENFPGAQVYLVDVIADRSVSDEIEERLGIRHESPQAILVESGNPRHSAAHRNVRADLLTSWWESSASLS